MVLRNMEKRKIFVFRINKGNAPGNPIGNCPIDFRDIKRKISKIKKTDLKVINYEDTHLDFIKKELWVNNTLRQGWGIENTSLDVSMTNWIENFMFNGKIYWNADISCKHAKGRHNILKRMLEMKKGDIVLIPKTSRSELNNYHKFVACEIEEPYYFDLPHDPKDFGHCIRVKSIKEFSFNSTNLLRGDFGSPYICAIMEVKNHHSRFNRFDSFIKRAF